MLLVIAVITVVTLVGSFACSIFEAALYAIPIARVRAMEREGKPGAARLLRLRESVDEPIAAILTLNTITHTVGASVAGGIVLRTYGDIVLAWFTAGFTLAMLLGTEIIPKTLGVRHAASLAPRFAFPIQVLIWVQYPLVWVTSFVTRLMGDGSHLPTPSEQEIISVAEESRKGGEILPSELRLVKNALELDDVLTSELMLPKEKVEAVSSDTSLASLRDAGEIWNHSRIPVTDADRPDHASGFVLRRAVFDALAADRFSLSIADLQKPVQRVGTATPANELMATLIRRKEHLAVVEDDAGGYVGIVTLEDVIERLIGQPIVDEYDEG
jgi:CBS domain containing-hemolysin-like protein